MTFSCIANLSFDIGEKEFSLPKNRNLDLNREYDFETLPPNGGCVDQCNESTQLLNSVFTSSTGLQKFGLLQCRTLHDGESIQLGS